MAVLVNSRERSWVLITVVGGSGMGVVPCRLSLMVVLVLVSWLWWKREAKSQGVTQV